MNPAWGAAGRSNWTGAATPPAINIDTARLNRNLLIFLIDFELFLVAIDVIFNYAAAIDADFIRRLCNIAREDGLATWFMVAQTLLAALTLFLIYWLHKSAGSRRRLTIAWLVPAIFFTFLAAASIPKSPTISTRLSKTTPLWAAISWTIAWGSRAFRR